MMIKFRESGQPFFPFFRATSPVSQGTLKGKGGGKLIIRFCADGATMPAKMITYRFFYSEGLITEFVEITYRFPSLRASFSSQVKMSETGFIPGVPFLSQVKNTGNWLRRVCCLYLNIFLNFYCKYSTIQHTFSTHHTRYTTTHSIQDPHYISTAHHITSHHMTSPDITPHALSHTTHYTTLHTQHHIAPQPKLANLLCPLDCVCGVGVWVVCVLCLHCVCFGLWSASFACWVLWSVSSVWSLLSVVLCRVVISLVFCASCAFWCAHQHMVIVCRVCVVSVCWGRQFHDSLNTL